MVFTQFEVCEILDISEPTLRSWRKNKIKLHKHTIEGKKVLYTQKDIETFLIKDAIDNLK